MSAFFWLINRSGLLHDLFRFGDFLFFPFPVPIFEFHPEEPLVLKGMLVDHPFFGYLPREDRRIQGEDLRAEDRVIDMPYDNDQEGQHGLIRMGRLGGRDYLPRQKGRQVEYHGRKPQGKARGYHKKPPYHHTPVLEFLLVVVPVAPGRAVGHPEVVPEVCDRIGEVLFVDDHRGGPLFEDHPVAGHKDVAYGEHRKDQPRAPVDEPGVVYPPQVHDDPLRPGGVMKPLGQPRQGQHPKGDGVCLVLYDPVSAEPLYVLHRVFCMSHFIPPYENKLQTINHEDTEN
jgi:hypothetical protein